MDQSQHGLYIGAKVIKARPKSKDGIEGYEVLYPDGYVSWSPKETFETAYRLITDQEKQFMAAGLY